MNVAPSSSNLIERMNALSIIDNASIPQDGNVLSTQPHDLREVRPGASRIKGSSIQPRNASLNILNSDLAQSIWFKPDSVSNNRTWIDNRDCWRWGSYIKGIFGGESGKFRDDNEKLHKAIKIMLTQKTSALKPEIVPELKKAVDLLQENFHFDPDVLACIFLLHDAETIIELHKTVETKVLITPETDNVSVSLIGKILGIHFREHERMTGGQEMCERTLADMAAENGLEGLKMFRELAPKLIAQKKWSILDTCFLCVGSKVEFLGQPDIDREDYRDAFERYLKSEDNEKPDLRTASWLTLVSTPPMFKLYYRHRPV